MTLQLCQGFNEESTNMESFANACCHKELMHSDLETSETLDDEPGNDANNAVCQMPKKIGTKQTDKNAIPRPSFYRFYYFRNQLFLKLCGKHPESDESELFVF